MKKLLLLLLIPAIFLASCTLNHLPKDELEEPPPPAPVIISSEENCTKNGGTYDATHKECVNITKEVCESISGTFNECASPCRHDPAAEMCIQSCVTICQL